MLCQPFCRLELASTLSLSLTPNLSWSSDVTSEKGEMSLEYNIVSIIGEMHLFLNSSDSKIRPYYPALRYSVNQATSIELRSQLR